METKLNHPPDEAVLRRYLLGELSEAELDRVEERLFAAADRDSEEQLSPAEDELIDSYVRGELSASEREHFESWFLTSPRRRERLELARTWHSLAG